MQMLPWSICPSIISFLVTKGSPVGVQPNLGMRLTAGSVNQTLTRKSTMIEWRIATSHPPHTPGAPFMRHLGGHGRRPFPDPQSTSRPVGQIPMPPLAPLRGYKAGCSSQSGASRSHCRCPCGHWSAFPPPQCLHKGWVPRTAAWHFSGNSQEPLPEMTVQGCNLLIHGETSTCSEPRGY